MGGNRNCWKEDRSRKKKVSTESNLPCLPPSMLRHTKEADLMGSATTELQIHSVTASEVYNCAAFPIGSDAKTSKVFFQSQFVGKMLSLDKKHLFVVPPGPVPCGEKWLQKTCFLKKT